MALNLSQPPPPTSNNAPKPPSMPMLMVWATRNPPQDPTTTSFTGKTVLVTGANAGLGLEAAVKYAALGATRLILAVRSVEKGESAKKEIITRTNVAEDVLRVLVVDMASFASVASFCRTLASSEPYLDIALLNAGIGQFNYQTSTDGWEMTLQVNVLSTALMALLLLPVLKATAVARGEPSHLEIVGSGSHEGVRANALRRKSEGGQKYLELVNAKAYFGPTSQYGLSKLMSVYVVLGIAEMVKAKGKGGEETTTTTTALPVIVTTSCPGSCSTSIYRTVPFPLSLVLKPYMSLLSRTAEQGARTLVSASTLGPEYHGALMKHDRIWEYGPMVMGEEGGQGQVGTEVWREIVGVLQSLEGIGEEVSTVIKQFTQGE